MSQGGFRPWFHGPRWGGGMPTALKIFTFSPLEGQPSEPQGLGALEEVQTLPQKSTHSLFRIALWLLLGLLCLISRLRNWDGSSRVTNLCSPKCSPSSALQPSLQCELLHDVSTYLPSVSTSCSTHWHITAILSVQINAKVKCMQSPELWNAYLIQQHNLHRKKA